jgi:alpha-tubulin suppressor-like RCC1 family protein
MNLRSSFSSVAVYSVFLATDGNLYSWGVDDRCCLGHTKGPGIHKLTGPGLYTDGGFKDFAAGEYHNLLLTNKSRIFVWGRNEDGQLGLGHENDVQHPTLLSNFPDGQIPARVYCGAHFSAVLMEDGSVYTMGYNDRGQLGHGNFENKNVPTKVVTPTPVADITCGWAFMLALTRTGEVYGWGKNENYELQFSPECPGLTPTLSSLPRGLLQLEAGSNHALGLKEGGALIAWGWNSYGQCGGDKSEDEDTEEPFLILPERCQDMACGTSTSFFLMEDGTLLSCGNNSSGQLGIKSESCQVAPPQQVIFPYHESRIACFGCGAEHCFLISEKGDLYMWGSENELKLGRHSTEPSLVPVPQKWELPEGHVRRKWNSVFRWLFLGRIDGNSPIQNFHVEVIYQLVTLFK